MLPVRDVLDTKEFVTSELFFFLGSDSDNTIHCFIKGSSTSILGVMCLKAF